MPIPHPARPSRARSLHCARLAALAAVALVISLLPGHAWAQPTFGEVGALFAQRCTLCHSGAGAPLGLELDSYEGVMRGSERGAVVVPGDPDGSELVRRIRGTSQPRMPLTGPPYLSDREIDLVVRWVAAGAPQGEGDERGQDEAPPAPGLPAPGEPVTFAHVEPLLLQRCVGCHGSNSVLGRAPEGLRLETHESVLGGGERVVVVPGSPLASELYRRVVGHARPRMPLDGPPYLSDAEVQLLRDWIAQGAPDGEGQEAAVPVGREVRLHGTLTGVWELDGLPLQVTPDTRLDDEPTVGEFVEVRGVLEEGGGVRVVRVRPR